MVHGHSSTKQPKAMSNNTFKLMTAIMNAMDFVSPHHLDKRVKTFDITEGMTVVDYGVGPARYTPRYARTSRRQR